MSNDSYNEIQKWGLMTRTIADYKLVQQIGEGTYGQVYKAECRITNRIVALKKIRIHSLGHYGLPPTIIREIKILKKLQHPNMVSMLEVLSSKGVEYLEGEVEEESEDKKLKHGKKEDNRSKYKGNLYIVLEYISHDLTGLMDMAYKFTHVQVKSIFHQLLSVLSYMHEHKYVHRDIKCSNILIDNCFRVKLADFGLARQFVNVNEE